MFRKIFKAIGRIEWSKGFCTIIALALGAYGIWCGFKYYELCALAIQFNSIMPDATLAVTSVTTVLGALMSYLLYQAGLKNSRNKYGIDSSGQPFKSLPSEEDKIQEIIESEETVG